MNEQTNRESVCGDVTFFNEDNAICHVSVVSNSFTCSQRIGTGDTSTLRENC